MTAAAGSVAEDSPMKILVINAGSSTLKFALYEVTDRSRKAHRLAHGLVDRIGAPRSVAGPMQIPRRSAQSSQPITLRRSSTRSPGSIVP
jgi:acetate kinase